MSPLHMQALRRLLFFSVDEAARWCAAGPERPDGVAPRAWQYWERGERAVPEDVAETMLGLAAWREQALGTAAAAIEDARAAAGGDPEGLDLVWYTRVEDWVSLPGRAEIHWRPQCSVLAALAARLPGVARLVPFDRRAYTRWLGARRDGEQMRGRWAAEQGEGTA